MPPTHNQQSEYMAYQMRMHVSSTPKVQQAGSHWSPHIQMKRLNSQSQTPAGQNPLQPTCSLVAKLVQSPDDATELKVQLLTGLEGAAPRMLVQVMQSSRSS